MILFFLTCKIIIIITQPNSTFPSSLIYPCQSVNVWTTPGIGTCYVFRAPDKPQRLSPTAFYFSPRITCRVEWIFLLPCFSFQMRRLSLEGMSDSSNFCCWYMVVLVSEFRYVGGCVGRGGSKGLFAKLCCLLSVLHWIQVIWPASFLSPLFQFFVCG